MPSTEQPHATPANRAESAVCRPCGSRNLDTPENMSEPGRAGFVSDWSNESAPPIRSLWEPAVEISEVTRRHVFDVLRVEGVAWNGSLPDDDFLARIFDLKSLPSYDGRYSTAAGDIHKHCVMNNDWSADWVFDDDRFKLTTCADDVFLRFVCTTVHPVVRGDREIALRLKDAYNEHLRHDGWELYERTSISGMPVFEARRLLEGQHPGLNAAQAVKVVLNDDYVHRQLSRLEKALNDDPELAIGTAKEFVETVCKTVLEERCVAFDPKQEFPKLVRQTLQTLALVPASIPDGAKAREAIKVLLSSLGSIADKMADVRNAYGTGHGKAAKAK